MNNIIYIIFLLMVVFMLGNWLHDVSSQCLMQVKYGYEHNCYLTNGFWKADSTQAYHVSWYASIISGLLMGFISVYQFIKVVKNE